MKTILVCGLAAVAVAATALPALAQADKSGITVCTQYGNGFRKMPGSDTCVQMGGSLQLDMGVGQSLGNGDTLGNAANIAPPGLPSASAYPPSIPTAPATSSLSATQPSQRSATDPWRQHR